MRKARTIPENKSSILLLVKFSNFNPAENIRDISAR